MTLNELIDRAIDLRRQHPEVAEKEIKIIDDDGMADDYLDVVDVDVQHIDRGEGWRFIIKYQE